MPHQLQRVVNYGQAVNRTAPLNRGLVAWWLDFPQRRGALRWFGLTTISAPFTNTTWGSFGPKFNGSSAYCDADRLPVSGYPFSVNAWFNTTTTAVNQGIFSLTNSGSDTNYFEVLLYSSGTGKLAAVTRNPVFTAIETTANFSANTWQMATAVFSSASSGAIYLNGGSKGSGSGDSPSGMDRLSIGSLGRSSRTDYFSGMIRDVRLWNRALTDSEVAALYNASRTGYRRELNWLDRTSTMTAPAAPATNRTNLLLLGVG